MRRLLISGITLCLVAISSPAAQAGESAPAPAPNASARSVVVPSGENRHRWHRGHAASGRWATGGWRAYRRPAYGYVLPRYWLQPAYYIGNYGGYGLPAPAYGYGWSRYYDDAVLTDRYGRVYDTRSDIRWGDHDGGDRSWDSAHHHADKDGPVFAPAPYDLGGYDDDQVTYGGGYARRWVGTWYGDDGRVFTGEYRRDGAPPRGAGYDTPPASGRPHWAEPYYHSAPPTAYSYTTVAPYGVVTTTTVIQPTVTTTTYVDEVVTYAAPRRRAHKAKARIKPRPRCICR